MDHVLLHLEDPGNMNYRCIGNITVLLEFFTTEQERLLCDCMTTKRRRDSECDRDVDMATKSAEVRIEQNIRDIASNVRRNDARELSSDLQSLSA